MAQTESNDGSGELDKLLADLEKETLPEESENKAIIEKQIQKNKDEKKEKQNEYDEQYDVADMDIPEDETGVQFW